MHLLATVFLVLAVVIFLSCARCVWPVKSLRFLFRRNVSLGFSLKDDAILVFVCSRCQCLFIIELISGRFLLKDVVKCTCWLIFFSFSFRSTFRVDGFSFDKLFLKDFFGIASLVEI